ncbi:MAG: ubiquitin-like domain-containing protein [Candidatus Coprovivens sp.]
MNIEKINPNIKYIYHYTLKENVGKILNDKEIKSKDKYVFFTKSLEDSITAFDREMMQEGKLYIDVDGILRKRGKCNKDDYCILKIPYINDNQFYKFSFANQSKESIYTISISHKGSYQFKEAKILEFPKTRKLNLFNKAAIAAVVAGILFPYNVFAASWLDSENYDISWYTNETLTEYKITTPNQLAGLAYLVNKENETFESQNLIISEEIDLTANTWETIKSTFKGNILTGGTCGIHRIILKNFDGKLIENQNLDIVEYSYEISQNEKDLINVIIGAPYTVEKIKEITGAEKVLINNLETTDNQSLLGLTENDKIKVFTREQNNLFIKDQKGIITSFIIESGDSIEYIKSQYSEKVNIPTNKIVFKYNEKELNDKPTFADYNIQRNTTINAYIIFDINTKVEQGKGEIISSQKTALTGEKITISIKPNPGYELNKLIVNGIDKTNEVQNNEIIIECGEEDINIKASYELKEEQIINPDTGDNIIKYIILLITFNTGIILCNLKKIIKKS